VDFPTKVTLALLRILRALRVMCLTAEDAIISTKLIVVQSWVDVLWSFINNSIGFIGAAETITDRETAHKLALLGELVRIKLTGGMPTNDSRLVLVGNRE
jgi:hypothetical protein